MAPAVHGFTLARFLRDGSPDRNFGEDGVVTTSFGFDAGSYGSALAVQPDGKIVATGWGGKSRSGFRFVLARYLDTQPICLVPDVRRRPLPNARRAIVRSHCSIGAVERAFSRAVKKGRVISQRPRPKTHRPEGAGVDVTVSKGPRKRCC